MKNPIVSLKKTLLLLLITNSLSIFSQTTCYNNPLSFEATPVRITDCGRGQIAFNITSGLAPFSFMLVNRGDATKLELSNITNTTGRFNLASGDYNFTVTDANSCETTKIIRVISSNLDFSLASGEECISGTNENLRFSIVNASRFINSTVRLLEINDDNTSTLVNQVLITNGTIASTNIKPDTIYEFEFISSTGTCSYTQRFIFDACNTSVLSINDAFAKKENTKISLYPNPTSDIITITGIDTKKASILVYDITGNIIVDKEIDTSTSVDLNYLSAGHYFVKINSNNRNTIKELIKL